MPPSILLAASTETLVLAPVVGAYLCLSAAGLLRPHAAADFLGDLRAHPAAVHAVGAVAFFVGTGILSAHRHWATPAEIVLNLVAAWWCFEGAGMVADPARLRQAFSAVGAPRLLNAAQWIALPIGVYLLAVGLFGHVR